MVLNDFHGYSIQAGTHAVSLTVVIYALLLGGQYRKMTATQSPLHGVIFLKLMMIPLIQTYYLNLIIYIIISLFISH